MFSQPWTGNPSSVPCILWGELPKEIFLSYNYKTASINARRFYSWKCKYVQLSVNLLKVNIYLHFYLYGENICISLKKKKTQQQQFLLSLSRNNQQYNIPAKCPFLAISSKVQAELYSLLSICKTLHICLSKLYFDSWDFLLVWPYDSKKCNCFILCF